MIAYAQLIVSKVKKNVKGVLKDADNPAKIREAFEYCAPKEHPDYVDAKKFDEFYLKLGEFAGIPNFSKSASLETGKIKRQAQIRFGEDATFADSFVVSSILRDMAKARDQKLHLDEFVDFMMDSHETDEETWQWQGATEGVVIHRADLQAQALGGSTFNAVLTKSTFDAWAPEGAYVAVQIRSQLSTVKVGFVDASVCFHERWGSNVVSSEADLGAWRHLDLATNSYCVGKHALGKFSDSATPLITSGGIIGLRLYQGQLFFFDASHGAVLLKGALNGVPQNVKLVVVLSNPGDKVFLEKESTRGMFPEIPEANQNQFIESYEYFVFRHISSPRGSFCFNAKEHSTTVTTNKFRFDDGGKDVKRVVENVLYVLDLWKNCEKYVTDAAVYESVFKPFQGDYKEKVRGWIKHTNPSVFEDLENDEQKFEAIVQGLFESDGAIFKELMAVLASVPDLMEDMTIQPTEQDDWTCIFELLGDANMMDKILDRKLKKLLGHEVEIQRKGKASSEGGHERALKKACFRFGRDFRRLTDLSKKAIICSTPTQMVDVAKALVNDIDFEILSQTNDFKVKEMPLGGYRKVSLTVRFQGLPHLSEIEIHCGRLHNEISQDRYQNIQHYSGVLSTMVNWTPRKPYVDCCPPGIFFPEREAEVEVPAEDENKLAKASWYAKNVAFFQELYDESIKNREFNKTIMFRDEVEKYKNLQHQASMYEALAAAEEKAAKEKAEASPRFNLEPPGEVDGVAGLHMFEYKRMDAKEMAAAVLRVTTDCGLDKKEVVEVIKKKASLRRIPSFLNTQLDLQRGANDLACTLALFLLTPQEGAEMQTVSEKEV